MQTLKALKTSDKPKRAKSQNKTPNFINHSKLVEQDLMTSHEYEQIYYKNTLNQVR
jgi:hypothetical protein